MHVIVQDSSDFIPAPWKNGGGSSTTGGAATATVIVAAAGETVKVAVLSGQTAYIYQAVNTSLRTPTNKAGAAVAK